MQYDLCGLYINITKIENRITIFVIQSDVECVANDSCDSMKTLDGPIY